MNILFLLACAALLVGAVVLFVLAGTKDPDYGEGAFWCSVAGILLTFGAFVCGGDAIHQDTDQFRVEKTPYRIIVTVGEKEQEFKDHFSWANSDKIHRVRKVIQTNAWGQPQKDKVTLQLLFAD